MIQQEKLVAIIRNVDPRYIIDIAKVISFSGIHALEVSLSEPERGFACIHKIMYMDFLSELTIGAGTVSKKSEVDNLVQMGVQFIVTPGFDPQLVSYALEKKLTIIPGVLTPTDVQKAVNYGLEYLKLFPANAFGMNYIKSLKGPFPKTQYMAVGGVDTTNAADFLRAGFLGLGIGSNLVPQNATDRDLKKMEQTALSYVELVKEAESYVSD